MALADPAKSKQVLDDLGIPTESDFHALSSDKVEMLLKEAIKQKYHKPKNANGSRARYFFYRLQRAAQKA